MNTVTKVLLLAAGALFSALPAAAVPVSMTHSGRLLAASGDALNGSFPVTVALYSQPVGGSATWTQTTTVLAQDGYYTMVLGQDPSNPLDGSVLGQDALFIGIAVAGTELATRSPLHSVPYAAVAGSAEVADSVAWGNVQAIPSTLADGQVAWGEVQQIPADFADGTDANTTYSAGPGLQLSGTTFAVNTATIQSRVTSDCPAGQGISAIAADGTVTCSTPAAATSCGPASVGAMRYGRCGLQVCDGNAWQGTDAPYTGDSYDYTSAANQTGLPAPWELHWDDAGQNTRTGISTHLGTGIYVQSRDAPYFRFLASPTCVEAADVQILAEVAATSYASLILRGQGDTYVGHSGYQLDLEPAAVGGTARLHKIVNASGTSTYGGRSQIVSASANWEGAMRVRYEIKGDRIRARWWSVSDPEPTSWGIDVVDTSIQGTGAFGLTTYTNWLQRWGKIAWSVTDEDAAF